MERLVIDGRGFTDALGEMAGRTWRQLRSRGPQTVKELAQAVGRSEADVHAAIGWLAREGKIRGHTGEKVALVDHEMQLAI